MPQFSSQKKPNGARKTATAKPMLTSSKRKELLAKRLDGLEALLNRRADMNAEMLAVREESIDRGTALIISLNKDDLVRTWCAVADESVMFARIIDPLITGGIYGEAVAVTLSTLLAISLIRGWITPDQLPGPVRALLPSSMFGPPPPSQEVQEEQARQAAASNGKTEPQQAAEEPTEKPPTTPRSKPAAKKRKQTDDKK